MGFSPKQRDFIFGARRAFINIADGAVRSGKTFASIYGFTQFALENPKGDLVITGRTERTIKRNVISPMIEMLGTKRVKHVQGAGEVYLAGRKIYLIGANDESAEAKMRGFTAIGGYCNELTLQPEAVFTQLIDRCSLRGARIYGDTNPDSPYHWLNTEFLENEEALRCGDVRRTKFLLTDNPSIPQEYIDRLHRLHSGVWLKRMVYGMWVAAEGAVYGNFDPDGPMVVDKLPKDFDLYRVGADYGTSNPTCFLLLAREPMTQSWYVIKEYYYDSKKAGRQKTDAEYSEDFREFIDGYDVATSDIDPSAASFKRQLKNDGVEGVKSADNAVLDGIRRVDMAINASRLFIHSDCRQLIKSLSVYAWDPKAQEKGEDAPLKINDHCFVAGTPVETEWGPRPIEDIAEGERVWTRYGLQPVTKTWHTPDRALMELELSDGRRLTGTANHPIFVEGKGFVALDSLRYGDIMCSWPESKPSSSRASSSGDTLTRLTSRLATISGPVQQMLRRASSRYTSRCGRLLTVPSLTAITSTTRTAIRSTTSLIISNAFLRRNTPGTISNSGLPIKQTERSRTHTSTEYAHSPASGIVRRRAESGTGSTVSRRGPSASPSPGLASNAGLSSRASRSEITIASARTPANQGGAELPASTTRLGSASFAEASSRPTNTARPGRVHVVAVRPLDETASVYNLTVAGTPEYFAGGVLVHNCADALRYPVNRIFRRSDLIGAVDKPRGV